MFSHGPNSAFESETFGEDLSFHIEQPVGSMSISPCARDVVLASKEGLHIIDLDSPYSPPRYLPHRTSWEVADVQWSPFAARDFWVISTSNQKALVWNLGIKSWQDSVEFVLHGHTRAITDINFSAHNPDVLATCAVDSFVHCWDLRVPARPVISFSDWFAGATQVKWSRQVSYMIASSHDKYLRIWDERMGAYPVRSIEAHDTKIYGIDWNRHESNRIVTCSLDKSIKFWDCNNLEDDPERIINTSFPAWRARHTPFGSGLLAMPQRGNGDLHLYDRRPDGTNGSGAVSAVARFEGHKGQVKEFLWRPRGTIIDDVDHRDFQLVTWGTDQELRLHRMVPETLSAVGYEKGMTQIPRLQLTRQGAKYRTFRDEPSEEILDEVFDSQAGSSPAAGQSFTSRPRGSTSVGISKVAIPQAQGWLQGGKSTTRVGMHGKKNARQIMNPIDWMKNVKITSWNPETLGEEIAQVGEKFAKVAFEPVDMSQRKAVISMHAPWGTANAPIFMKVDIKFPIGYPREAAAIFHVQKTAAMTDELAGLLSTELRTIAETYVARRRGCLEAVVRYLLREQDMEQIVSWILDESLENSKIVEDIGFAEELSSDEDDVGLSTFQGPSGIVNSSSVVDANANALVPVPKGCGALWAANGMLTCFFLSQSKQPASFLELLGTRSSDADKSDKIFEGFGKLQTDSPGAKTTLRTVTSREYATSELSDDSSFSASSSSGSSDSETSLPAHFLPQKAWRAGGVALQRSRSADYSTQSAIAFSKAKHGAESSYNTVSIRDFSDLIPSKRDLAMEYIIFGRGPELCEYNADVALKHDHEDVSCVWHLMKLILWDEVPLESYSALHRSSDVLTIARSVSDASKGNVSGVDLSHDIATKRSKVKIPGRVRWGESTFGGNYLVPWLIHYFESLGDVQMLAMLSCIFAEPRASNSIALLSQQQNHLSLMQLKAPAFSVDYYPSPEVARSALDKTSTTSFTSANTTVRPPDSYHVNLTEEGGSSHPTTPCSTGNTPPDLAPCLPADRRRSSRLSGVDAQDHNHRHSASTSQSGPVSLSTSPEDTRSAHRSNSNMAFALSRASLSALAPPFSQSPPNSSGGSGGHKRSSPVGSFIGHHVNASGWSAANVFGGSGYGRGKSEAGAQTARHRRGLGQLGPSSSTLPHSQSLSSDGDAIDRGRGGRGSASTLRSRGHARTHLKPMSRNSPKRKVNIKSTLHNQNMFDEDGYASVPLLDPSLEWKYRAYRASYAHLLGVWGLHTQRAEVLKFDGLHGYFKPPPRAAPADRSTEDDELALGNLLGRKTLNVNRNSFAPQRGLEIRRPCNQCGQMLNAIQKNGIPIGWHCSVCALAHTKSSTRTLCTICTKSITGLMVPCLNCGHVACFECHSKWLARDNTNNTTDDDAAVNNFDSLQPPEKTCPTGCDCICSIHQLIRVPSPPSSPSPSPSESHADPNRPHDDDDDDDDTTSQSPTDTLTGPDASNLLSPPESAMSAFLSLSRTRSISSSIAASDKGKPKAVLKIRRHHHHVPAQQQQPGNEENGGATGDVASYADAWAKYANMGKGLGYGLSRTMATGMRGSEGQLMKETGGQQREVGRRRDMEGEGERESEAEKRLRRAGSFL